MKSVLVDLVATLIFLSAVLIGGYIYLDSQPKRVESKPEIFTVKHEVTHEKKKVTFEEIVKETTE